MPSLTPRQLLRAQIQQSPPSDLDKKLLEKWLCAFDQDWTEAAMAEWAGELPREGEFRRQALVGMVKIDLRHNWKKGGKRTLESYLTQYPDLGTPDTVALELIQAEIEARRQVGDPIALEEVAGRFPRQLADLARGVAKLWQQSPDATRPPVAKPPAPLPPAPPPVAENIIFSTPGPTMHTTTGRGLVALPSDPLRMDQIERYRLMEVLGRGAMGTVYLAEDTKLGRQVALKVPHFRAGDSDELLTRFYTEARAAATLNHPNICPVYDVGENDGVPYLTMAFIKGRQLSDLIKGAEALPPRRTAEIVKKLALALQEAHSHSVIHRDLKPSNIMMNERGEPVVMDFGLARRLDQDARRTHEGSVLGTPAYMAPEQVRGAQKLVGPRCDVYSLGVILYEMLTGQVPFPGNNMYDVLARILTETPPAPRELRPELDEELERICLMAMAKEVESRYQSMGDFAVALGCYLDATAAAVPQVRAKPASAPEARVPVPPERKVGSRDLSLARALVGVVPAEPVEEGLQEPEPEAESPPPLPEVGWRGRRTESGPRPKPFAGLGKVLAKSWKVLAVAVVFLAAGIAAHLLFRETPEGFLADIEALVREEKFADALERIQATGQPEEVKEQARRRLHDGALRWSGDRLQQQQEPQRVIAVMAALLKAFPKDPRFAQRLQAGEELHALQEIRGLVAAGDFKAAWDRLAQPGAAGAAWAAEQKAETLRAWVASARGHLEGARFVQAEAVARTILKQEPGCVPAKEIRDQAAVREAERLLARGDFAGACAKAADAPAEEGKRLRAAVLNKWHDAAADRKRARDWQAARAALTALLKCYPEEGSAVAGLTGEVTSEQLQVALTKKDRAALGQVEEFLKSKAAEVLPVKDRADLEARAKAARNEIDRPTAAAVALGDRLGAIEAAAPGLSPGPVLTAKLAELQKLKKEIDDESDPRPLGRQWATVEVLLLHRDPTKHGPLDANIKKLFTGGELPYEPAKLCHILAALAGSDPTRLREASETVAGALKSDRLYSKDRDEMNVIHGGLLTARIKSILLRPAPDWEGLDALLGVCDAAGFDKSEWVIAARAERLLERHGGKPAGPALRDAKKVYDLKEKAAPGRYLHYVRGRVMRAEGLGAAAAKEILNAYQAPARAGDGELLTMLRVGYRRGNAVTILHEAAKAQRQADPFAEPYKWEIVDSVYQQLKLAHAELNRAGEGPDDDLALHVALAAAQKKDATLLGEIVAARPKLPSRLPDKDAIPFLLGKAGALDGKADKLRLHAEALERATSYEDAGGSGQERFADLAAKVLRTVVEPGIKAGLELKVPGGSDARLRETLARLYAGRARRYADHRRQLPEPGQERAADEETVRSYTQAIELAPDANSDYYAGRVTARLHLLLSPLDRDGLKTAWPELRKDEQRACEIDDKAKGRTFRTRVLSAYLMHVDVSHLEQGKGARTTKFLAADKEYALAVAAADKKGGRELASVLSNRARLLLELGNFDAQRAKEHFELALEQANKAIEALPHRSEAADLHAVKGRVLEDLAWKAGEKGQYDRAVEAYKKAIDMAESNGLGAGQYRMDLGRAQFRAQEFGRLGGKYLAAALASLREATKEKLSDRHAAEAHHWLGRAHWAAREYEAAESAFAAVKHNPWRADARRALPRLCLDAAQFRGERGEPDKAEAYQAKAITYAGELESVEPAHVHHVRGKVLELKQQHEEARKEYEKSLYQSGKDLETTVLLWSSNLYLCLDKRWKDGVRINALKTDAAYLLDTLAPHVSGAEWALTARTRALFHGAAGLAHAHRGEGKQAIASFQKAVSLTAPNDPDGWRWRFQLASQMEKLLAKQPEYREQAQALAREASTAAPETHEARPIQELINRLKG